MHLSFTAFLCSSHISEIYDYLYITISTPIEIDISDDNITFFSLTDIYNELIQIYHIYNNKEQENTINASLLYKINDLNCLKIKKKIISFNEILTYHLSHLNANDILCYPSPLHTCIDNLLFNNDSYVMDILLSHNFNPNTLDMEKNNLLMKFLHYKSIDNYYSTIINIISKTVDLNLKNINNSSVLFLCIVNDHFKIFNYLLNNTNIDINCPIIDDITIDIICIVLNKVYFFKELIVHPLFNFQKTTLHHETLPFLSIMYNNLDCFKLIVPFCDLTLKDIHDNDIVSACIIFNKMNYLDYLLFNIKHKLNMDILNFFIINYGYIDKAINSIIYLIRNGSNINEIDTYGNSPIINSVIHEYFDITELLLQFNPNLLITNNEGYNILDFLIETNKFHLLQLVLNNTNFLHADNALKKLYMDNNRFYFKYILSKNVYINDCMICFAYKNKYINPPVLKHWSNYYLTFFSSTIIKKQYLRYKKNYLYNYLVSRVHLDIVENIMSYVYFSDCNHIKCTFH